MRLLRSRRAVASVVAALLAITLLSMFAASLILVTDLQNQSVPEAVKTSEEVSQLVRENLEASIDAETGDTVHIKVKNTGTVTARVKQVLAARRDGTLEAVTLDPLETLTPLEERVFPVTVSEGYVRLGLLTERGNVYVVKTGSSPRFSSETFDFTFSVDPNVGSVQPGGSVQTTVTVTLLGGSPDTVTLTASGLPSGASASFNPSSGNPTFTSTLTISTDADTPTGTHTITITGTGGGLTRTTTYTLTVTSPSSPFDFSVSVSPSSGSVERGNSITATVTVSLLSGSTQTVTLSASGLPSGASASFNPSSGEPTFTSTVTISTSSTIPTETYTITMTGTAGSLTRTATYTLTVTSPSPPPSSSYTVTFTQSDLPSGTLWSVTLGETTRSSTSSTITFNVEDGTYSWSVSSPISGSSGTRYVASPSSGSMNVPSQTSQSITYTKEYELKVSVSSSDAGTTDPAPGSHWYSEGSTVSVSASPSSPFTVTLSASGFPSGASGSFNPSSGTPPFTSTLTITVESNTQPGTYTITISATKSGYKFSHWTLDGSNAGSSSPFSLTMDGPHDLVAVFFQPNVDISVSPSSITINQGGSDSTTVTVTEGDGSSDTLTLTVQRLHRVRVYTKDVENYAVPGVTVTLGSLSGKTNSYGYVDFYVADDTYSLSVPSPVTIWHQHGSIPTTYADSCPFYKWDDGTTSNSRSITVSGAATYTARYKLVLHFAGSYIYGWGWSVWPPGQIHYFFATITSVDPPEARGHVESTRGTRISGAKVTAYFDITTFLVRFTRSGTAKTDSNGHFSVDIYAYDALTNLNKVTATVSKTGYVSGSWSSQI